MNLSLFWICLLLEIFVSLAFKVNAYPIIKPGDYQRFEIKPYEQKLFQIPKSKLSKNTKYEVRISFLGTVGAEMALKWRNTGDITFHSKSNPLFRPLDTANLFFTTNNNSEISEAHPESVDVKENEIYYNFFVFMYRNSLARNKELAEKPAEFIITILPVLMSGLGYNIVWAYASAIIISSLILCVLLPRTMKKIPYFKEFLVRDYDPQKRIK